MNIVNKTLTSVLTASIVITLGLSGLAHAIVPAESPLGITVVITHGEEQNVIENVESATFTVELVPTAPYLSSPGDQVKLAGKENTYSYKITALANGPDTYTLNSVVMTFDNLESAPELSFKQDDVSIGSVTLGVTAASEPSPAQSSIIKALSDGTADTSVNGIQSGDSVVIAGAVYMVNSVLDDGNLATITLADPLQSDLLAGDSIAEQQAFVLVVAGVAMSNPDLPATATILVTATSEANTELLTNDETITSVFAPIDPTVKIYVRNATNIDNLTIPADEDTPVAYSSLSGEDFYDAAGQVSAVAGDTIEYAIVQLAGNTKTLTGVTITAGIPLFTSLVPDSYKLNGQPTECQVSDPPVSITCDLNSPGLESDPGTILIYSSAELTFQVTVDSTAAAAPVEPVVSDKIPWTPGNPACWDDETYPYKGNESNAAFVNSAWVVGECRGTEFSPIATQEKCDEWASQGTVYLGTGKQGLGVVIACK
jgi:hypothetical protein